MPVLLQAFAKEVSQVCHACSVHSCTSAVHTRGQNTNYDMNMVFDDLFDLVRTVSSTKAHKKKPLHLGPRP